MSAPDRARPASSSTVGAAPDVVGLDDHLDAVGCRCPTCAAAALIDALERSGLRGHGGAWFPVGTKWRAVAGRPVEAGGRGQRSRGRAGQR